MCKEIHRIYPGKAFFNMANTVIENGILRAEIAELGGEIQSLGRLENGKFIEYFWQGLPEYWSGRSPLLFPIVGRLRGGAYTYGGKTYEMRCHGFAPRLPHKVTKTGADSAETVLEESPESLAQYPIGFRFTQTLTLDGNTRHIKIKAVAKDELWCAFGGHPGFVLPDDNGNTADFDSLYVRINDKKAPERLMFSDTCFVLDKRTPFPLDSEGRFHLTHKLFDDDAVVLCDVKSATLCSTSTKRSVTVTSPDANWYGFWQTRYSTDAPFLCLEPWQGIPSYDGDDKVFDELDRRPGMYHLMPGESAGFAFDITLE